MQVLFVGSLHGTRRHLRCGAVCHRNEAAVAGCATSTAAYIDMVGAAEQQSLPAALQSDGGATNGKVRERAAAQGKGAALAAVQALNSFDIERYIPFFVSNNVAERSQEEPHPFGFIEVEFALHLQTHAEPFGGRDVLEVDLDRCEIAPGEEFFSTVRGSVRLGAPLLAMGLVERSKRFGAVLASMRDAGLIEGWRDELQPVVASFGQSPCLLVERAAVPYLGVQSFATHVNGFRREGKDVLLWVARRAKTKATYAGRLDQMVAGGQPVDLSLQENVEKECVEEAAMTPQLVASCVRQSGVVSYRYAARKGLSTKTLFMYDAELPADFVPRNTDGEVDSFELLNAEAVLDSFRSNPELWKPNSALVMLSFCMRHGVMRVDNEPDYIQLAARLHTIF